jgi:hypothetical protein
MKKGRPPMTATNFAKEMGISYPTVIRWLDRKLVPGAELKESPERGKWWEIPESALKMERPTPGPKKGTKRGPRLSDNQVATSLVIETRPRPEVKPTPKKRASKKAGN